MNLNSLDIARDKTGFGLAVTSIREHSTSGPVEVMTFACTSVAQFESAPFHPVFVQTPGECAGVGDDTRPLASVVAATRPEIPAWSPVAAPKAYTLTADLYKQQPRDDAGMLYHVESTEDDPYHVYMSECNVTAGDVVFLTGNDQTGMWFYRVGDIDTVPGVDKLCVSLRDFDEAENIAPARRTDCAEWMGWLDGDWAGDALSESALETAARAVLASHRALREPAPVWIPGILGPVQPKSWQAYRSVVDAAVVTRGGTTKLVVDDTFYARRRWLPGDAIHLALTSVRTSVDTLRCAVHYLGTEEPSPADCVLRVCIGTFVRNDSHPYHDCCAIHVGSPLERYTLPE